MLIIKAKENLEYRELVNFFKTLKSDDILIIYNYPDETIEDLSSRQTIVKELFNRNKIKDMMNQEIVVELFNEGVLLETTIEEIHRLSTPARIRKFLELTGVEEDEEEIEEESIESLEEVEESAEELKIGDTVDLGQLAKPKREDVKVVAVGQFIDGIIEDIEAIVVGRREVKKAIDFLNEQISKYHVHGLEDFLRINLNYDDSVDINLEEWLPIETLFERGLAK